MKPLSLLLFVSATLAAGAPINFVGAEARGLRPAGVNFVQGATDRGRIQLTGGASATATISVGLATNVFAGRPPVSMAELEKGVKEIPFSFKAEKSRRGFAQVRGQPALRSGGIPDERRVN